VLRLDVAIHTRQRQRVYDILDPVLVSDRNCNKNRLADLGMVSPIPSIILLVLYLTLTCGERDWMGNAGCGMRDASMSI
jgi:hypothetical protein